MAVKSDMSCGRGWAEEFCPPPLCGTLISPKQSLKTHNGNVNPQISAANRSKVLVVMIALHWIKVDHYLSWETVAGSFKTKSFV